MTADAAAPYIVGRDPIIDVGSARTLSLAKALVDECVAGHEHCRQITVSLDVRLPSRLVDCTDLDHPRLVSTKGEHGKYLALSYVWGEAQPHKTTSANVSAYHGVIARTLLPQTILDAIYVTHTLGFRYLWTDSLCIVQDSDEDKLHEIGKMHLIYRYAYLTIIAASAERVSDGFLQDRSAPPPPKFTLPFVCPPHPPYPEENVTEGGVQRVARGEVHYFDEVWDMPGDSEPVDRRGWCLQELLMSSRALIFASKTLRFRCQDTTLNVGDSIHRTTFDVRLPDILFHPAPPPIQPGSAEWCDVHLRWRDVVQLYSARTLGKASDKLVACGALAEAFQRVLRCDYLAGLWRSDMLLYDLLWRVRDPTDPEFPTRYRAPSWSWAAVDGQSICDFFPRGPEIVVGAKVIRCDVILKDLELPFGEVTGGSLVLRARLIPCKVRKTSHLSQWGVEALLPPPCREPCGPGGWDGVDEDSIVAYEKRHGQFWADHRSDILIEGSSSWLVPFWWNNIRVKWPLVGGLVVTLANPGSGCEAENKKIYRRIGTFYSTGFACNWDKLRYHELEEEEIEIV